MSAAALALVIAAGASGPVVLRGQAAPDPRPVVAIGPEGVALGEPLSELVGWDRVKLVTGADCAAAKPFMQLAEDAWRARTRLARGDLRGASALLESLAKASQGQDTPLALLAHAGLARCRISDGDTVGALLPALEAARLLHAGLRPSEDVSPVLAIDVEAGVFPELAPTVLRSGADAAELAQVIRSRHEGAPSEPLARAYAAALDGQASDLADARSLAAACVLAWRGEPAARERARQSLRELLLDARGSWREAWIRAALGRSLALEQAPASRRAASLELLHIPARFERTLPAMAAWARAETNVLLARPGVPAAQWPLDVSARPEDDPYAALESLLLRAGQDDLLAAHLESRREQLEGSARAAAARRLAEVYARLMDARGVADPELRERAGAILPDLEESDGLTLRLALARQTYDEAERTAEAWQLRLVSEAQARGAARVLIGLEASLSDIASAAGRRVEALERQEEAGASGGVDGELLTSALTASRRTRSMAQFLAGWSACHAAQIETAAARELAQKAERHFGALLNARSGAAATLDRVPVALLRYEHVARAALGVALALSAREDHDAALAWLDMVEKAEATPPAVRAQIRARRIAVLASAKRWDALGLLMAPANTREDSALLSPAEARLLAVRSLEAIAQGVDAARVRPLARAGIQSLASAGELAQVLDLAARFFDRLDETAQGAFLPAYIRGLRAYERGARALEPGSAAADRPADVPSVRASFREAAQYLATALASDDAGEFAAARGGVERLRGLATFYAAESWKDLALAAGFLEGAARRLDASLPDQAASSRRAALVAYDLALGRGGDAPELTRRKRDLADEFIRQHPGNPATDALVFARATDGTTSTEEAVRRLLAIPERAPIASRARHHAARLLYERFLAAKEPQDRAAAAAAFLDVAEPLHESVRAASAPADAESVRRSISTARRVLDVLLSLSEPPADRAQRALDGLRALVDLDRASAAELAHELRFRAAQVALARGRWSEASDSARALEDEGAPLAASALRLMLKDALDRWSAARLEPGVRLVIARQIIDAGRRVLAAESRDTADLTDQRTASILAAIAQANAHLFRAEQDDYAGREALEQYLSLLSAHPRNAQLLREHALLAEERGLHERAHESWRTLAAGLEDRSDAWFEARVRSIETLARFDPEAARAALEQHRVLFPTLGPTPWGERLLSLQLALPRGKAQP
ncbi:MAG: hypothetical protein SFZ24_04925 [Planctomycetota bacterium]|nr:hypothetical protein [Planctomycetota bacterium]